MKNEITVLTEQQLEIACPMAFKLPEIAKENGLDGTIFQYKEHQLGLGNTCNRDGLYFVIFTSEDAKFDFQKMMVTNEWKKINDLIDNIDETGDCLNTRICMRPLNKLTQENTFASYQKCLRAIHDLAAVKAAYGEFGYRPPEYVAVETVNAINSFIDKRFNPNLTSEMRRSMDEGMKKFIDASVERYKKNKPVRFRTIKPHMVRQDYFLQNGVTCVNCGYSEDFLKYLKTRWDEEPDFVMYQEKVPYESYKDHSKAPQWIEEKHPELSNLWSDLKGYKMYRVSYPIAYKEKMHGWMFDYLAKGQENWEFVVPLEELDRTCPLRMIEIDDSDMHNWISLCEYNHVKCAINHGEMGEVKDSRTFSFIYSEKDYEMISAIKRRLSRELSEFRPLPEEFVRLSEDGLKKLEEKDRAYAEKMARKRARLNVVKSIFFKQKEQDVEEQAPELPDPAKEKEMMDEFFNNEEYDRPDPWKKYGYEKGTLDYD